MNDKKNVEIWYCESCGVVHIAAGEMRMNFNREEFAVFMEMVVETHYTAWPHLKTNLVQQDSADTVN